MKRNVTGSLAIAALAILFTVSMSLAAEEQIPLKLVKGPDKNIALVELQNPVPVAGVQFKIEGARMTEVRTTKRTAGFICKFNDANGMVLMVSATGDEIAPGSGSICDIVCDNPDAAKLVNPKVVAKRPAGPAKGAPAKAKANDAKEPAAKAAEKK